MKLVRTPDLALALVVAVLLEGGALASPGTGLVAHLTVLAGSLGLVVWRAAPLVALAVATVFMLVFVVTSNPGPAAAFPVLVAMFETVRSGHRLAAAVGAVAFLGGSFAIGIADAAGQPLQPLAERTVLMLGWFLAAAVAGSASRGWRAYLDEAEHRAAEAERTREEAALRRAGEERLRIARELHDSLTHSISIIKVQAGVAVHLARKRGEEVPTALLAIQEASREAMRELRATLEVLRDSADDPPATGLDRLDDLVGRARAAGLPTTVTIEGDRRPLPAEADRAAYRIVQEALTNIARHAGPATASVRIRYADETLLVQVDDDGRGSPATPPVPGVGLRGMRERVTGLGGHLRAEPRLGGGFTVQAELPLTGSPAAAPSALAGHPQPEAPGTPAVPAPEQSPAGFPGRTSSKGSDSTPAMTPNTTPTTSPDMAPSSTSTTPPDLTPGATSTTPPDLTPDTTPTTSPAIASGITSAASPDMASDTTSTRSSGKTPARTSARPSSKSSASTSTRPSGKTSARPSDKTSTKTSTSKTATVSTTKTSDKPSDRLPSGEGPEPVAPLGDAS
ncbi:sensor histidine kinase [Nonomuraea roseoviolacea]|uniref:histidine kinase n=1 Tax=Nonomuraea roseoviolacea subsp. carminata TaxID=160689 RepID=A0ABT1KGR1_9ACTN|nr:sensor histidine kinase [Nonomuraea roseoviolacea]MCP2352159.1 signal transduction histidine kinase [Nonomuraea roseoviolacea subsp. carminata]